MYEFFSIVDATHDDPTIFPVLSGPESALPFEWEQGDGQERFEFVVKRALVWQQTSGGWTKIKSVTDLSFTVVITQGRVVVFCKKFIKGGGWRGFGVAGLTMMVVANGVSHARAAARRRGKLLVAQVRYDWLRSVAVSVDSRGRPHGLRFVVDAGTSDESRPLAVELIGGKAVPEVVRHVAQLAALAQLRDTSALATEDVSRLHGIAADPERYAVSGTWVLASTRLVGERIPGTATATVETTPELPTVPAQWGADPWGEHCYRYFDGTAWTAHVSDGDEFAATGSNVAEPGGVCVACGNLLANAHRSCSRCGMPRQSVVLVAEATTSRAHLRQSLSDAHHERTS